MSQEPEIELVADANNETAEVELLDGNYNIVGSGIGRAVASNVKPGVYKARFRMGGTVQEQVKIVRSANDARIVLSDEKKLFPQSATPIAGRTEQRNYHWIHAERISKSVDSRCSLFVFLREREDVNQPLPDITVWGLLDNELVYSLRQGETTYPGEKYKWCGGVHALAPGCYRVRFPLARSHSYEYEREQRFIEQAVYLRDGWQTQLFFVRDKYGKILPDQTSQLMAKPNIGFQAHSRDLSLMEAVRQSLLTGVDVTKNIQQDLLHGKFKDPLLGIYGAQFLNKKQQGVVQLQQVIDNLRRLLGTEQPDVEALALRWGIRSVHDKAFDFPPLLRQTWDQLSASNRLERRYNKKTSFCRRLEGAATHFGPFFHWSLDSLSYQYID